MIHTHNRLLFVDFLRFVLFIVCVCVYSTLRDRDVSS